MYAVTRRYAHASELIDAIAGRKHEVEDIISKVPGFVSYYAIRSAANLTTVSVFDDRAHADESTRQVREWVQANLPNSSVGAPETTGGEVFINFSVERTPA